MAKKKYLISFFLKTVTELIRHQKDLGLLIQNQFFVLFCFYTSSPLDRNLHIPWSMFLKFNFEEVIWNPQQIFFLRVYKL